MPDADGSQPAAELATFLEATVREAGELALKTFRGPLKQWLKGASSPVCEADIAVDLMLRDRLTGNTSRYGWLSEETEDDPARLDAESIWIVDPIDGPRAQARGSMAQGSPAQKAGSIGSLRSRRASRPRRVSVRWPCAWRGSRPASSMARWRLPTATTGTLQRLIFWCTKPAAR